MTDYVWEQNDSVDFEFVTQDERITLLQEASAEIYESELPGSEEFSQNLSKLIDVVGIEHFNPHGLEFYWRISMNELHKNEPNFEWLNTKLFKPQKPHKGSEPFHRYALEHSALYAEKALEIARSIMQGIHQKIFGLKGPMMSGKSSLIGLVERHMISLAKEEGKFAKVIYAVGASLSESTVTQRGIITADGLSEESPALPISSSTFDSSITKLERLLEGVDYPLVFFDEATFTDVPAVLKMIEYCNVKQIPLVIAGLPSNYLDQPLPVFTVLHGQEGLIDWIECKSFVFGYDSEQYFDKVIFVPKGTKTERYITLPTHANGTITFLDPGVGHVVIEKGAFTIYQPMIPEEHISVALMKMPKHVQNGILNPSEHILQMQIAVREIIYKMRKVVAEES